MNKLIFAVLLFTFASQVFSQEKEPVVLIQGSKDLPAELNLIVESLQTEKNDVAFMPTLFAIDSYARLLSKEDIFLIGKIEIYKTLLKSNTSYPTAVIDGDTVTSLREALKNTADPFIKWFLQALLNDCESLLANPNFKDYLLQRRQGTLDRPELKKIHKKVQLIYRWTSKIGTDLSGFEPIIRAELVPVMIESLKCIEESFYLMAAGTSFSPLPPIVNAVSDLKFFSLKKTKKPTPKVQKKEKSVDDILAPITDEGTAQPPALPEPSKEEWLNNENAPSNLKNLPKPSDDANWLQDF